MSLLETAVTPRFATWCAQTNTVPQTRGDIVGIPHTMENRKVMESFCDYKLSTISEGVIWLRPRRGNELF